MTGNTRAVGVVKLMIDLAPNFFSKCPDLYLAGELRLAARLDHVMNAAIDVGAHLRGYTYLLEI